jgi:hypothetical protein
MHTPLSWVGASARTRLALAGPVLDTVCLGLFVLLGRESHAVDGGRGWFLVVVWPFVVGWFAAALPLRLYASPTQAWLRLGATAVIGVAIGLLCRVVATHRDAPGAFILVAYGFIVASTVGWRVVAAVLLRAARRSI